MTKYILNNNSFTMDTRNVRLSRLYLISSTIEEYASEICLEQNNLDWALDAYSNFHTAQINQSIEQGQKNELSKISLEADSNLYERYIILKELVISRYANNKKALVDYGVDTASPTSRRERYFKAQLLSETHNKYVSQSDKNVLPQLMIDNLNNLIVFSNDKHLLASSRKANSLDKTNLTNELFNEDSIKIRNLYNWSVAFWGKKDPRLYFLGFIPNKSEQNLGENLKNINILYDKKVKKFYWNDLKNIEYYQIAKKDDETMTEWVEIGKTQEPFMLNSFELGTYILKLRVWTKNGFSGWSDEFSFTF